RRRDVEVLAAVVVDVSEDGRDADPVVKPDAGPLRDVREAAPAVVVVERVRPELVAEVDVVAAVAVVVGDGDARAVVVEIGLELLALLPGEERHLEVDPRLARPLDEPGRPRLGAL